MQDMQYSRITYNGGNMEFVINRSMDVSALSLTIVEAGHSFPKNGKTADTPTTCYQLHFVTSGKGSFREREIHRGSGFLVLPGEAQNMKVESDDFEQYWINFCGADVPGLLRSCGIPLYSHIFDLSGDEKKQALAFALLKSVFPQTVKTSESLPQHSHTYLLGLFYQLLSINEREMQQNISVTERYVSTVCSYIHIHYSEPLTVEWLAAVAGLSPKYLIRLFKKITGGTIIEYITDTRMKNACVLLESTDKTVGEIAESIGYGDALYFSRVFRLRYGLAPSIWRKNHKKV